MIVNVNPYDTGYHENAAVMEFSALASEISTVTTKSLLPTLTRKVSAATIPGTGSGAGAVTSHSQSQAPEPDNVEEIQMKKATTRQVRLSIVAKPGTEPVERVFEVVEGRCPYFLGMCFNKL
jgi:hypothetical protein